MRAIVIRRQGSPVADNVELRDDWPDVEAGPGEVLVRTEAAALNQLDLWVGRGVPGLELAYPRVSGSDGCGIVEAAGAGVDESWIGRRVLLNAAVTQSSAPRPGDAPTLPAIHMIGEHVHGTLAERFVAPATNVLDVGDHDAGDAAAFGLVHLTAWRMLATRARLQAGQTVLVTGIGGGVALACLGIARHFGCRVLVTSRHRRKLDRALERGADEGILDEGQDWSREVRALTSRRGVDVCADSIGRAVHVACIKSLARGGTFVSCGATTGAEAVTDLGRLFWNQLTLLGTTMGDMAEFRAVVALLRAGALTPAIDRRFSIEQSRAAFARLEGGEQFGKIVVQWA